jgi:hypothetical protein
MRITQDNIPSELTLALPERSANEAISIPENNSKTQNRSLKSKINAETLLQPNLQNILAPTINKPPKNRISTIAKITVERLPYPAIGEGGLGDYLVGYYYHNLEDQKKAYTIFITLENGERYMAYDLENGLESYDECIKRIPSFLTVGSQVEVFPSSTDRWEKDRIRPLSIIKDINTGKEYAATKFFRVGECIPRL